MVTVIVDDHDPTILYTGNWDSQSTNGTSGEYNKTSHGTFVTGSGWQLRFNGCFNATLAYDLRSHYVIGLSITVFGTIPVGSNDTVRSTYSVDGGANSSYSSPKNAPPASQYQQIFFRADGLDFGWHTIAATVGSVNEDFSYWLDYVTYDVPDGLSPTATTPSPTPTVSTRNGAMNPHTMRIVVPSVVLPSVAVLIAFILWWWRLRLNTRRRSRDRGSDDNLNPLPNPSCTRTERPRLSSATTLEITPYVAETIHPPMPQKRVETPQPLERSIASQMRSVPPPPAIEMQANASIEMPPPYTSHC